MKKFIAGLVLGLLILPVCGYLYLSSGRAPAATADPPLPFEERLAKMALRAREGSASRLKSPIAADEAALVAGAKTYRETCAVCHGLLSKSVGVIPKGMFPYPPQLLYGDGVVTDDPVGMTYWKVANGIRLSGMPAFKQSFSDAQLWQVALLLNQADKLPPAAQDVLK